VKLSSNGELPRPAPFRKLSYQCGQGVRQPQKEIAGLLAVFVKKLSTAVAELIRGRVFKNRNRSGDGGRCCGEHLVQSGVILVPGIA
jgi:hypothetical protein